MFTLGIPKRDYRRATQVLDYESHPSIPFDTKLQDDGFYLFSFPEADEDAFKKISIKLKGDPPRQHGPKSLLLFALRPRANNRRLGEPSQ